MSDPAQCPHDFYRRAEYCCVDCESAELKVLEDRIALLTSWLLCRYMHGDIPCMKCGFVGQAALVPPPPVFQVNEYNPFITGPTPKEDK